MEKILLPAVSTQGLNRGEIGPFKAEALKELWCERMHREWGNGTVLGAM